MRTPPHSDSGEATPQITHKKRSCCKLQEDFYFKSALGPTIIHHAGLEDHGTLSSWGRGYLKEETTTQGGGEGVVGKYQKYQLRVTRKWKVKTVFYEPLTVVHMRSGFQRRSGWVRVTFFERTLPEPRNQVGGGMLLSVL